MSSRLATPSRSGTASRAEARRSRGCCRGRQSRCAVDRRARTIGIATTRWSVRSGTSSAASGETRSSCRSMNGKPVAARQRPCDAVALDIPLVPKGLCERPGACPATGGREPVARDDLGRRDELRDEIGDRLEAWAASDLVLARPGAIAEVRGGAEWAGGLEVHGSVLDRGIGRSASRVEPRASRRGTARISSTCPRTSR